MRKRHGHWIRPTMLPVLQQFAALPNVTVRPSALGIDDPAPEIAGLSAGTAVTSGVDALACPSTATAEKHCDDHGCRRCWSKRGVVSYVVHGVSANTMRKAAARMLPVLEVRT